MRWEKLGRIIVPDPRLSWNQTHAMVPTTDRIDGNIYRVYFSGRDRSNVSHIGAVTVDITRPGTVLDITERPVLGPGELGCFDDNGVTPSWIVNLEERKYLYYIGWKPRSTTRMSVVAGLAQSTDNGASFERVSRAPILRLTDTEPYSILTAPCVLKEGERWKMWYVSGTGWIHPDLPRYNIKYAESTDGVRWNQPGIACIDPVSEDETSLARPCVLRDGSLYRMWYSTKRGASGYRIGYAESEDGREWERMDDKAGIDVSDSGWDSEMIEYAFVFRHDSHQYMLFNGNNYGRDGAGLAVLVEP